MSGKHEESSIHSEPQVLEYVEVIYTADLAYLREINAKGSDTGKAVNFQIHSRGRNYIKILSPAVSEALRCIVDYFPNADLSGSTIDIYEPYEIFIFYERQLNEYRERLDEAARNDMSPLCINRYASKHISIVQQFVRERTQAAVEAERERHARGYATFDMLWLLYKPGIDVYYDHPNVGEHEPYSIKSVTFDVKNGATSVYGISFWNMKADFNWVGPSVVNGAVERFAGEKKITTLQAFPCEYLRFMENLSASDTERIRDHFIERGKKWYETKRGKRWYWFEGHPTSFPRQKVRDTVSHR